MHSLDYGIRVIFLDLGDFSAFLAHHIRARPCKLSYTLKLRMRIVNASYKVRNLFAYLQISVIIIYSERRKKAS